VPLTVDGNEFSVTFDPFTVSVRDAAGQFCVEKGVTFGITQDTLESGCVTPVANILQEAIDKNASN
jgi:hypothetical protein